MKALVAVVCIVGVAGLALGIGSHIPPDTVALTVGVVVGAFTSIPVSVALGVVLGRRLSSFAATPEDNRGPVQRGAQHSIEAFPAPRGYPPVVIINPAPFHNQAMPVHPALQLEATPLIAGGRQFRVIGDEATS